ncbi:uncharacterized protein DNG_06376 [Cephalotrichum gorgonifer]|uniref:Xylanolytic transcriptional activator regulatory domain-containing protein n=1 Tax=Cephalotrichum gorgonifer TaxID=2041049 RepID=A0AAE8N1G5_9PEZI|nr:uncharacterized protein DNG_06376 [Cephalotrichum gorgonifer]
MRGICDAIQTSAGRFTSPMQPGPSLKRRRDSQVSVNVTTKTYLTSFVHSLDMAKSVLEETGVLDPTATTHSDADESPVDEAIEADEAATTALDTARPVRDLGAESAAKYFASFRDLVYPVFPCVYMEAAKMTLDAIFERSPPSQQAQGSDEGVDLIDIEICKAVLAIGMVVKDGVHSSIGSDLEANLIWNMNSVFERDQAQVEDVVMGTLLAIYFSLRDQEIKGWRMIGFATRTAFELGMHRARFYRDCDDSPSQIRFLKNLFACVSDVDKRCSFMTNLPCSLPDQNVDEDTLDLDGQLPYLSVMLRANSILAEIFELINSVPIRRSSRNREGDERLQYLDFRVQSMEEQITQIELFPAHSGMQPPPALQAVISCIIGMRLTFMRMLTHFRCLSSSSAWAGNPQSAQILISMAKSLVDWYRKTVASAGSEGINRLWGPLTDRYLMGSTSCMFLAAAYDPAVYGPQCRYHFHTALDLLMASSHRRAASTTKPWCSLDDMRKISGKIQMAPLEESRPNGTPSGSDADGSMVCGIPPAAPDDASFMWFEPSADDYLAFLGISTSTQDSPEGPSQMPFPPIPMYVP